MATVIVASLWDAAPVPESVDVRTPIPHAPIAVDRPQTAMILEGVVNYMRVCHDVQSSSVDVIVAAQSMHQLADSKTSVAQLHSSFIGLKPAASNNDALTLLPLALRTGVQRMKSRALVARKVANDSRWSSSSACARLICVLRQEPNCSLTAVVHNGNVVDVAELFGTILAEVTRRRCLCVPRCSDLVLHAIVQL